MKEKVEKEVRREERNEGDADKQGKEDMKEEDRRARWGRRQRRWSRWRDAEEMKVLEGKEIDMLEEQGGEMKEERLEHTEE